MSPQDWVVRFLISPATFSLNTVADMVAALSVKPLGWQKKAVSMLTITAWQKQNVLAENISTFVLSA